MLFYPLQRIIYKATLEFLSLAPQAFKELSYDEGCKGNQRVVREYTFMIGSKLNLNTNTPINPGIQRCGAPAREILPRSSVSSTQWRRFPLTPHLTPQLTQADRPTTSPAPPFTTMG